MILSKKIQIELDQRQFLIISTLLGVINYELNLEAPIQENSTQSIFYKNEIKKIGGNTLRLTFKDSVKERLREDLEIYDNYLFVTNPVINQIDNIVKVKLLSFIKKRIELLLFYEVEAKEASNLENRLLSVYLAEYEPITAIDSGNGNCFVEGLDYLDHLFYYVNEISRLSRINQIQEKCENPKPTKRMQRLIEKSNNVLTDIIHKLSRKITNYCVENKITTVLIGKAKNVMVFPIKRFVNQLKYKLKLEGINLIIYSSSEKYLNFNKLPEESRKLEIKVKQKNSWSKETRENRKAAFSMIEDYIESRQLNLTIPSLAF